jgi:hypothetical protein
VKQSEEKGAGQGLFAKVDLLAGTVIPYLGKPTTRRGTHIFNGLDGNPKILPYKGVGNRGLSIAAMANEPATKKPRCKFTRGYLVVAQKVKAGEELTVYYGPDYHRIGYSMSKNSHLDKPYPELEKVTLPTEKAVQKLMREVQGLPDPDGPLPQLERRTVSQGLMWMTLEERRRQDELAELLEELSSKT